MLLPQLFTFEFQDHCRLGGEFNWPRIPEVWQYRAEVKQTILDLIDAEPLELPLLHRDPWVSLLWAPRLQGHNYRFFKESLGSKPGNSGVCELWGSKSVCFYTSSSHAPDTGAFRWPNFISKPVLLLNDLAQNVDGYECAFCWSWLGLCLKGTYSCFLPSSLCFFFLSRSGHWCWELSMRGKSWSILVIA